MKTFVDFIYTVLIAVTVTAFIGVGTWAFYPEPKMPQYPDYPQIYNSSGQVPDQVQRDYQTKLDAYNKANDQYSKKAKNFHKNSSIFALAGAVVSFAVGAWALRKNQVVGEGLALGGVFTSAYAAIQAAEADSQKLVFGCISAALVMVVALVIYRGKLHSKPLQFTPPQL